MIIKWTARRMIKNPRRISILHPRKRSPKIRRQRRESQSMIKHCQSPTPNQRRSPREARRTERARSSDREHVKGKKEKKTEGKKEKGYKTKKEKSDEKKDKEPDERKMTKKEIFMPGDDNYYYSQPEAKDVKVSQSKPGKDEKMDKAKVGKELAKTKKGKK